MSSSIGHIPAAARAATSAFDGTGRAPSGPANANIAEHARKGTHARGPKGEGTVIRSAPQGTQDANHARNTQKPNEKAPRPHGPSQANAGQQTLTPRSHGGYRAV